MAQFPKYIIKSNLSEKQIEADVAHFFGWCAPEGSLPFRLHDVDERITGADKLYDGAMAIYIQFKKSEGLRSVYDVKPSTRQGRSPLEGIREFRDKNGLCENPTLFFQLRAKAKNAKDLQHNVLLSYERPIWSRAIYVAPLLLDKTAYYAALFSSSNRYLDDPFFYSNRIAIHYRSWINYLGTIPFLKEHVSIPPHERVTHHKHYYAYSESGVDISWHSPSIVGKEPSRLSDFLVDLFLTALANQDSMLSLDDLARKVSAIGASFGFRQKGELEDSDSIQLLTDHGRWLKEEYGIRQFLLLRKSDPDLKRLLPQ